MLNNIHVVVVAPKHSGNLGLAARAMKNTGLSRLIVVGQAKHRRKAAQTFGAPAKEILDSAKLFGDLASAVHDSTLVVGFTRREGRWRLPLKPFLDLVPTILSRAQNGQVHLVFGNERTGLSSEDMGECDKAVYLPSHPDFPSMNLSHAVMLAGYEVMQGVLRREQLGGVGPEKPEKYPSRKEIDILFKEFQKTLRHLDYRDMPRLKLLSSILLNFQRMAKRIAPTVSEVHMMRGVLARANQRLGL